MYSIPSVYSGVDAAISDLARTGKELAYATQNFTIPFQELPTQAMQFSVFMKLIERNEAFGVLRMLGMDNAADALLRIAPPESQRYDEETRLWLNDLFKNDEHLTRLADEYQKDAEKEHAASDLVNSEQWSEAEAVAVA